jgi:hypothetical protein
MNKCKKCGGKNCTCKKSIHKLAKANPNKTYNELEQIKAEPEGLVIDDTEECESCQ